MIEKLKNTNYFNLVNDINSGYNVTVTGFSVGEKGVICQDLTKPLIFVVPNIDEGEIVQKQLESLGIKNNFIKFIDLDPSYATYTYNEAEKELVLSLFRFLNKEIDALVVSSKILSLRLPDPNIFKQNILKISKNSVINYENLKRKIVDIGYAFQSIIDGPGQFSVRGDCIDIFPINSPLPYRISFFDDTIEFIKSFNIENFSSIDEVKNIDICPNTYFFLEDQNIEEIVKTIDNERNNAKISPNCFTRLNNIVENLSLEILNRRVNSKFIIPYLKNYNSNVLSYITSGTVIFDEVKIICDNINEQISSYLENYKSLITCGELLKSHKNFLLDFSSSVNTKANKLAFLNILNQNRIFETQKLYKFTCDSFLSYNGNIKNLAEDLSQWVFRKNLVIIFAENDINSVNLSKNLTMEKVDSQIINRLDQADKNLVNIYSGALYKSASFVNEKVILLSINQIYSKKYEKKAVTVKKQNAFYLPKVGDYVVHDTYGIAICDGIIRQKMLDVEKDYVVLHFKGSDKLYLPTEKIGEISSYISNGAEPKLSKLGSNEFEKEKEKVKTSIKKMAFSLVNLYADRQYRKGFRYNIDEILYGDFCKEFEYKETDDQLVAIDDIEKDMQSDKVMDRLVCGDVGFGKTEVAFRAIFIAAMNGKQVAFLCPTTILSEQHYNSCMTRIGPYMVNIEVLNRFKTPKQQEEILKRVSDGKVDILIGTSRLLSKDVKFKNLGLLVLDEEQKFGVEAKEKLKNIKKDVDVLTLSATPIPRTLHISMTGIRDISIIETPPENRLPVQTIVTEYSDNLIKTAVYRELKRNGQVLIIYNRVETILNFKETIAKLIPDAVIDIAHGQMAEKVLYNAIKNLYEHNTDILISTTLIENGVDLPTANTIICIDSQNLGLSELYQLKGRVGRSSILAYAYFTYPENKVLSTDSYKRLNAISEFSSLGSGFKIAMRDLEIRGAGNILGKEQHGHIAKIGYDMYCKLLKEATEELRGQKVYKAKDCKINISISAFIPNNFVEDNENRFRLYNTISSIDSIEEMEKVKTKIIDMYSSVPFEVENLMKIALIQNLASKFSIKVLTISPTRISFAFYTNEDMLNQKITEASKIFKAKPVYNINKMPIIDFEPNIKYLTDKIDFVVKFLSFCSKSSN